VLRRYSATFLLLVIVMPFLSGCSVFGVRSGLEQVAYKVIDKVGVAEIRQYPKRVVAEVSEMNDESAAFMLLFRYISGENTAASSVAMTTPVQVDKASTTIAMTTPVEVSKAVADTGRMRFFLPSSFTRDTAPQPIDPRIKIVELPAEVLAAVTYSGFGSGDRFRRQSHRLLHALAGSRWKVVSAPTFFGYDPPFTIPFLRRNEVVVRVE